VHDSSAEEANGWTTSRGKVPCFWRLCVAESKISVVDVFDIRKGYKLMAHVLSTHQAFIYPLKKYRQ